MSWHLYKILWLQGWFKRPCHIHKRTQTYIHSHSYKTISQTYIHTSIHTQTCTHIHSCIHTLKNILSLTLHDVAGQSMQTLLKYVGRSDCVRSWSSCGHYRAKHPKTTCLCQSCHLSPTKPNMAQERTGFKCILGNRRIVQFGTHFSVGQHSRDLAVPIQRNSIHLTVWEVNLRYLG